ncbi:MAG: mandelate racemase/muconate lactonizing enzyme family protein [Chloroflexi bacterium]|nr:mandelate racemase/muconate lactonizing enzyme family protein [Chloroflexota bacterium]
MKITDIRAWLTRVDPGRTWVFVEVDTDEGITGIGESTNAGGGGAYLIGRTYEMFKRDLSSDFSDAIVGQDPNEIERIWQQVYRRFTALGSRGFPTAVIAGLDMALWDIKGKATGRPVYDLLGGPVRDRILLYTHVAYADDVGRAVEDARSQVAEGYTALKLDPFSPEMGKKHRRYIDGKISKAGANHAEKLMGAIRDAVGPDVELMIDAHGNFDVPTAIELCNRMLPYQLTWFEEPCQPESVEALRQVHEYTQMPLCVGERRYTRYDFLPILKEGIVNFLMPDICWSGGITELRKIAVLAETFYVPVSPHDASGPLNVVGGAQTMMNTPNFYRLEMSKHSIQNYNSVLKAPLDIRGGYLYLSKKPGLGVELDLDFIKGHPDPDWEQMHGR